MKKELQILTLICLMVLSVTSYAKHQNGVYMTPADFVNNKLSYEADSKVRLNNSVLEMPYITVTNEGKKTRLNKSEVYGYVDGNNTAHRFYNNDDYQIAEASKIIIYIQLVHIAQSKGYKVMKNFYFSTSPDGAIRPLNIDNLKNAYHSNEKFTDLVEQYFNNGDIAVYDNIHNTYKVNYVYAKALK